LRCFWRRGWEISELALKAIDEILMPLLGDEAGDAERLLWHFEVGLPPFRGQVAKGHAMTLRLEFPRFRGQVLELHTNDCRGRRKALLVIDWTEETDR